MTLELGGKSPLIIAPDANINQLAERLVFGKTANAGQTCVCANRVLVDECILEQFLQILLPKVRALQVGAGTDPNVTIGPLIEAKAVAKVQQLLDDALQHGAQLRLGGNPHPAGALFFEPTVLTGVTLQMQLFQQEIFGPVLVVIAYQDEEEAVALVVNGFCKEVLQALPMEFAMEAQSLVAISLEGSVG